METLFVYGSLVVEKSKDNYHHNFLQEIIKRYSRFGHLTICTALEVVDKTTTRVVDLSSVSYIPIEKENTIKKRFLDRKCNRNILKSQVQKSDFVIVHVPSSESYLAASYARKFNKPYLVVVVGCIWDALWNYSLKGKLLAPLDFWLMKKTVNKARYAIYVTEHFLQRRYPSNGLSVGCSDVEILKVDTNSQQKRNNRIREWNKRSQRNLVTIGGIDVSFKGQQYVIESIANLNRQGFNFHYYIIGYGTGQRLKVLAQKLKVDEYVHFMGGVSHDKIFDVLCDMDIYIQPSKLEGLPRSLVEAMSVGMPAIASRVGGCPELLNNKFLFPVGNIKEISLLLQLENDIWVKQSFVNIEKSKSYLKDVLDYKRNVFLNQIRNNEFL